MSLVYKHEGRPALFQVENKIMSHEPPGPVMWTLVSEPVDGGEPWRIEGPTGTPCIRVVPKRQTQQHYG